MTSVEAMSGKSREQTEINAKALSVDRILEQYVVPNVIDGMVDEFAKAHAYRIDLEMRAPIDPEAAKELAEIESRSLAALAVLLERRRVVREWKEAEDWMQGE